MKIRITNYTFSPGASNSGTVTFNSYSSITLDSILLITNVTRNIIIYNFADPTAGGTVNGNILTLGYNTSAMSSSDKLLIYYDDPVNITATDNTLQVQADTLSLLKRIAEYTSNLEVTDNSQRLRVVVENATGSMGVTNISGISTITGSIGVTNVTSIISAPNVTASLGGLAGGTVKIVDSSATQVYSLGSNNPLVNIYTVPDAWKFLDAARLNFKVAIRENITFV